MNTIISNQDILMNDSLGMYLGYDSGLKDVCNGAVDGSNKKFIVPNGPIYPVGGMGFVPTLDDIQVYTRKGTGLSQVDTAITTGITLKSSPDPNSGDGGIIFNEIDFTTAPTTSAADSVVASYVEQIEPFVMTDLAGTVKQTTKDVPRMNSSDTMTGYGSMTFSIKASQTMSEETIDYIQKLQYEATSCTNTPQTGATAYDMRSKPIPLYGFFDMHYNGELGRIYFEQVKMVPALPDGKSGSELTYSLEMTTPKLPRLVLPTSD